MYVLKTFDKTEFNISELEALAIAEAMNAGKQKAITLQGNIIALSSISAILKEEKALEHGNTEAKFGVLHDGTRVIRQFGEWFCMSGEKDENNLYEVRPDIEYYPEVRANRVPSLEMFNLRFEHLPTSERLTLMLDGVDLERMQRKGGLQRIENKLIELE